MPLRFLPLLACTAWLTATTAMAQGSVSPQPAAQAKALPGDSATLASGFVSSYAAAARPHDLIGHWSEPVCVHVVGLADQQKDAVRARVESVAKSLGVTVQAADCRPFTIEIGFTNDPQAMLDGVKGRPDNPLGDVTSGTRDIQTVTLPIQAWYVTDGVIQASDSGPEAAGGQTRRFQNVFVIVDLQKAGSKPLGLIADYVAMLALSQPRALDRCKAAPSITDLFTNCSDRPSPPEGLTSADAAYLTALYTTFPNGAGETQEKVIQHMAGILAGPKQADR